MNPEVKAKWLEALRSGKYKQGKEFLKRGNKFCCLGVLCDISGLDYGHHDTELLPLNIAEYAELPESPDVIVNGKHQELVILNDGKGYGFKRLANLIEKYL